LFKRYFALSLESLFFVAYAGYVFCTRFVVVVVVVVVFTIIIDLWEQQTAKDVNISNWAA